MTSVAATQFLPVASTAVATGRSLVVSVHDVAPSTWEAARQILSALQHRGVRACSILVVPDYHRTGRSMANQAFVSWLRDVESEGHEIVIHGYYHSRPRSDRESLVNRFLTRIYTQDEGEFFDLGYEEARRRITEAKEDFEAAGLKPHGFIAPAWLLSAEAERAARDAGIEYTTRLGSVRHLRSGDAFRTQSLVYSVRTGWRRQASVCWNGLLAQLTQSKSLVRLAIHPVDYEHCAIWRQTCRLAEELGSTRTATTYHDWVAEWRIRRSTGL
jgi:predicted deacetylase